MYELRAGLRNFYLLLWLSLQLQNEHSIQERLFKIFNSALTQFRENRTNNRTNWTGNGEQNLIIITIFYPKAVLYFSAPVNSVV